jgi:hypothetical protein
MLNHKMWRCIRLCGGHDWTTCGKTHYLVRSGCDECNANRNFSGKYESVMNK